MSPCPIPNTPSNFSPGHFQSTWYYFLLVTAPGIVARDILRKVSHQSAFSWENIIWFYSFRCSFSVQGSLSDLFFPDEYLKFQSNFTTKETLLTRNVMWSAGGKRCLLYFCFLAMSLLVLYLDISHDLHSHAKNKIMKLPGIDVQIQHPVSQLMSQPKGETNSYYVMK